MSLPSLRHRHRQLLVVCNQSGCCAASAADQSDKSTGPQGRWSTGACLVTLCACTRSGQTADSWLWHLMKPAVIAIYYTSRIAEPPATQLLPPDQHCIIDAATRLGVSKVNVKKIDYSVRNDESHCTCTTEDSGKEWLTRWVFKCFLKTDIDDADVRFSGRVFHSGKVRSPTVERRERRTTSDDVDAQRRHWRASSADDWRNSSASYGRAVWCRHPYTRTACLNSKRSGTFSVQLNETAGNQRTHLTWWISALFYNFKAIA